MSSLLTALAVIALIVLMLFAVFLMQTTVASRLIVGTLSEPVPMLCNVTSQWLIYNCKRNPLTGLGCIVPESQGRYITGKSIAIEYDKCLPDSKGQYPGSRIVSFSWSQTGSSRCRSSSSSCCVFGLPCTQSLTFLCNATGAGTGGENQCLPAFLPAPAPQFDAKINYTTTPITVEVGCTNNYCGASPSL